MATETTRKVGAFVEDNVAVITINGVEICHLGIPDWGSSDLVVRPVDYKTIGYTDPELGGYEYELDRQHGSVGLRSGENVVYTVPESVLRILRSNLKVGWA